MWAAIQRRHPDVPPVVVTLGAGSIGVPRGSLTLGHFAADRWTGGDEASSAIAELFIGGEGLIQGAKSVLATLLHEAAHGIAHVRQIQDTSRQGRYHNNRYKLLGEEVGLAITQVADIGWSGTALADGTASAYASELVQLAGAITAHRYAEGSLPGSGTGGVAGPGGGSGSEGGTKGGGAASPKNGLVLTCDCPRRIRLSAAAAAIGPITCGVCATDFN